MRVLLDACVANCVCCELLRIACVASCCELCVSLDACVGQVVLWAETFQRTRRHFFSASALKRRLLTLYLGVTVFLYVMLILLYSLFLFSTTDSPRMLDAIYVLLALLDLLVPMILLLSWCCMAFIFSGFPIRYGPIVGGG